jgi:acyl-coenzyme A thioesterase 13
MSSNEPPEIPTGFEPLFRTSPFLDALGPFYSRQDEGGLAIGLRISPKHANARGLAHGGLLLTLCDIALGYAAAYTEDPPLTLTTAHIDADFAGSARVGDWVESRADVQRIGGRLAFVNVYLVVNSIRIVRASGVYLR